MAEARAEAATTGHVAPMWIYIVVYVGLIALTGATVGAAFVDLGPLNNVVALGIAAMKAGLVVLYFMHVRWSSRLIPLAIFAGVFWLFHLVAGSMTDYFTRGLLGVPGK
jgi:cytochrome c oxidase subunit 4